MRRIGSITTVRSRALGLSSKRQFKQLPDGVNSIKVALYKPLPSLVAVVLDVHLNKTVTDNILAISRARYPVTILVNTILPWRVFRSGFSRIGVFRKRRQAILERHRRLKMEVESLIRPYFEGLLLGAPLDPGFGAISMVGLVGAPKEFSAFCNWSFAHRQHLETVGLNITPISAYKGDAAVFALASKNEQIGPQFVVLEPGDDQHPQLYTALHVLDEIQDYYFLIVLLDYLWKEIHEVDLQLKRGLALRVTRRRFDSTNQRWMSAQFRFFQVGRILHEFQIWKEALTRNLHSASSSFKEIEFTRQAESTRRSLSEDLQRGTENALERLSSYVELCRDNFAGLVQATNMKFAARNQIFAIIVSLVALFVSISSLLNSLFSSDIHDYVARYRGQAVNDLPVVKQP